MGAREEVRTGGAPAAVGPYSQGIRAGGLVFVSGQLGIDPATGKLCSAEVEAQAERVLENLKAVIEAAGSSLDNVVKTTVYLTDINEFAKVNAVYGRYFQAPAPARATVQVAALPLGAKIEIEAIGVASR